MHHVNLRGMCEYAFTSALQCTHSSNQLLHQVNHNNEYTIDVVNVTLFVRIPVCKFPRILLKALRKEL